MISVHFDKNSDCIKFIIFHFSLFFGIFGNGWVEWSCGWRWVVVIIHNCHCSSKVLCFVYAIHYCAVEGTGTAPIVCLFHIGVIIVVCNSLIIPLHHLTLTQPYQLIIPCPLCVINKLTGCGDGNPLTCVLELEFRSSIIFNIGCSRMSPVVAGVLFPVYFFDELGFILSPISKVVLAQVLDVGVLLVYGLSDWVLEEVFSIVGKHLDVLIHVRGESCR